MRGAVRAHMRAIAEKYVIEGETAEGALMFLPSEAVYAELHANFGDLVREGFALRVWIVSPTTCMATLHTLRAVLKDARLRAEAHAIRRELGLLHKDVERLAARVGNLDRHFGQAQKDIEEIEISADRTQGRGARRLEAIDFSTTRRGERRRRCSERGEARRLPRATVRTIVDVAAARSRCSATSSAAASVGVTRCAAGWPGARRVRHGAARPRRLSRPLSRWPTSCTPGRFPS